VEEDGGEIKLHKVRGASRCLQFLTSFSVPVPASTRVNAAADSRNSESPQEAQHHEKKQVLNTPSAIAVPCG
jgi:hypothetical protein